MYETGIVAAIILNHRLDEEAADRRAFYGPDVQPETEEPRRRRTLAARILRRKDTNLA